MAGMHRAETDAAAFRAPLAHAGSRTRRQRGVTAVELLIGLSIVAILASVAAPAVTPLIAAARVNGASSDFGTDLGFARAEAIRRGVAISVCARATDTTCGQDWSNGWLMFVDGTTPGVIDAPADVFRARGPLPAPVSLAERNSVTTVRFRPTGTIGAPLAFDLRYPGATGRDIDLQLVGRVITCRQGA